tara:strand:- start:110907 stop:111119 length:213 start_codon:yes stop_codon:yes gene_type:complete
MMLRQDVGRQPTRAGTDLLNGLHHHVHGCRFGNKTVGAVFHGLVNDRGLFRGRHHHQRDFLVSLAQVDQP